MSALVEDHEGNWELIHYRELDFKSFNPVITPPSQVNPEDQTHIPLHRVAFDSLSDDTIEPNSFRI
jgi:hypothetical protein